MNIKKLFIKMGLKKAPPPSNFVLEFYIDGEVTNAADAEETFDLILEILSRIYDPGCITGGIGKETFNG